MLQIDDKIISLDVITEYFFCDLFACKGICCVEGNSGAPLDNAEIPIIEKYLDVIKKYLPKNNLNYLQKYGFYETDKDGDLVTTCIDGKECVFAVKINGIYKCAIQLAYENNEIDFPKPLSCHLFPIRLKKYETFTAVNLVKVDYCKAGFIKGKLLKIKAYQFLKEPIIRAFGQEFYKQLSLADDYLQKQNID